MEVQLRIGGGRVQKEQGAWCQRRKEGMKGVSGCRVRRARSPERATRVLHEADAEHAVDCLHRRRHDAHVREHACARRTHASVCVRVFA
eukprot:632772-Pleurochrysis_carterae.AAC.1